ncbi:MULTISPECIES: hypothetical protein [unclassified Alishewanella]|uniref:hypothetical protein n=1 Tax=unclassified Alishewanella TaxID=2628974 RepID=UPI0040428398
MKNALLGLFCFSFSFVTHAALIDLNSWSQEGNASNGNWVVAADGKTVLQTINGNPTFFVSNDSFINNVFTGSFGVETTSDDDFIGFVFGYTGLDDFYLFDWKQSAQFAGGGNAEKGFTLSKISAGADVTGFQSLWVHTGTGVSVLDTDYGVSRGWLDNVFYDFRLIYTATNIEITIDGGQFDNETIFSLSNLNNSAGRFGFYNLSQSSVRYSGFEEEICTVNCGEVAVSEPQTVFIFCLGLFGLVARNIKRAKSLIS